MADEQYKMGFDPNTLGALGIQMYASFQPVILELLSNAYDAEATDVTVEINYDNNSLTIEDNGVGMSFTQLNSEFLRIGRNRRQDSNHGLSKNKKRLVTGKKGLGKLSAFGIAKKISVTSSSEDDQYLNGFVMDIDKIMDSKNTSDGPKGLEEYIPEPLYKINSTKAANSFTKISIEDITLSNIPDLEQISKRTSLAFRNFDADFKLKLSSIVDGSKKEIQITSDDYFNQFDKRLIWKVPDDPIFQDIVVEGNGIQKLIDLKITGSIFTTVNPMKKIDAGIKVFVRGKLTIDNFYFDLPANDNFSNVLGGYVNFDFVDKDDKQDYVASGRQMIFWDRVPEHDLIFALFKKMLGKAQKAWRESIGQQAQLNIDSKLPTNFFEGLNKAEEKTLKEFKNSLIKNTADNYDETQLIELLGTAKDMFKFSSFTEFIEELDEKNITPDNVEKITKDWSEIEAKELAKVASGRISAIEAFEKFIRSNSSENKVIQPFLEKFPWLMNPRATSFEREVTYNRLLKEHFPNADLPEGNKRLDFITTDVNGKIQIIELKRPGVKLGIEQMEQILKYRKFIEDHKIFDTDRPGFDYQNDIEYYLVSDDIKPSSSGVMVESVMKSLDQQHVYLRSYTGLLQEARQYNRDLIKVYNEIADIRGKEPLGKNEDYAGTSFKEKQKIN